MTPHRRVFIDRSPLYLFSYDVETDMDRDELGFVPGGVRVNIFARPNLTRAYNVMRERTVAGVGEMAIKGSLEWGGDWLFWRDDDLELSEVQMTIRLDDGEAIHVYYPVIAYLGPGGFRRIVSRKDKFGTEDQPVDWPVVMAPRFEASGKYAWLMDYQGLGFGLVRVIKSEVRRITYDVYALT